MKIKNEVYYLIIIFFGFLFFSTNSYAVTGYIDTSATNTAKVCKDVSCTSPTPGTINFELISVPSVVVDSVTGISGYVWGNELGWVLLNPTGQGVTFANSTTGLLTGRAWSQVSGWINFAPTGQSVSINPITGEFSGWAWTGGPYGGWIKFDCGVSSTCVRSTWKPSATSSGDSGGGGGGGALIDVCPNIFEAQQSIPSGYTVDSSGNCISVPKDLCPNIIGEQNIVPFGYSINTIGACTLSTIDFCSNITGDQTSVPNGYTVDIEGNCLKSIVYDLCPTIPGVQSSYSLCKEEINQKDVCSNLFGVQPSIPIGYYEKSNECFPETFDLCPNIEGYQSTIPDRYTIGADGYCVFLPPDLCSNLAGYQDSVPRGFNKDGSICLFVGQQQDTGKTTNQKEAHIIAFPFVPKSLQVPTDNVVIKNITTPFITKKNKLEPGIESQVDVVSAGLVSLLGLMSVSGLFLFLRFLKAKLAQ